MSLYDSYAMQDAPASDHDEIDSLPSTSTESFHSDDDYDQREWEQSLEQLQLLLTMILVPFAGKYFGRKFAYWSWSRYMEWMHNVEIQWSNKKAFKAAGAVEAAASV
jgi:hypothetical protein